MTTKQVKSALEVLYCILADQGHIKSQPSILTKFGCGGRATRGGYTIPIGAGGLDTLELPKNRLYKRLHRAVLSLPPLYQNMLCKKYTTNITNKDLAEEQHIQIWTVKKQMHEIYKQLKANLDRL